MRPGYLTCEQCGRERLRIDPDLGCPECASANVAPNVLRWMGDREGYTPLDYSLRRAIGTTAVRSIGART